MVRTAVFADATTCNQPRSVFSLTKCPGKWSALSLNEIQTLETEQEKSQKTFFRQKKRGNKKNLKK